MTRLNDHLVDAVSDEAPRKGGIGNVSTGGDECDDFRGDPRETRERELEYRQLEFDARRGK